MANREILNHMLPTRNSEEPFFFVRVPNKGKPQFWIIDGTTLTVNGKDVFSGPVRQTVDRLVE